MVKNSVWNDLRRVGEATKGKSGRSGLSGPSRKTSTRRRYADNAAPGSWLVSSWVGAGRLRAGNPFASADGVSP